MAIENIVADSFLQGDEHALRTIYDRYGGVVLHFTTRLLGDGPDAADVVRDTFVAAWAGRARYEPDSGSVLRWLLGMAWHASTDALRPAEPGGRAGDDVVALRDPASAAAVAMRMIEEIVVADELARLSQERRRCLHLAFGEKQTVDQISDLTGLPPDAVRSHLRQGIRNVRRRLEVDGAAPAPGSLD